MDFSLSEEQRAWQLKAREFAQKKIAPISLERDGISDPRGTWDWEIIKQGSKLGFRTAAVPKEWGGYGIDFVTQAVVMAELAKGDSAISKAFSQCWKWSHLIAEFCNSEQKERFLKPFLADDTYMLGSASTEPNSGSDNRLPPDEIKAGFSLRAERRGDEWILNGEKCFIANGNVGKLFFVNARTNPSVRMQEGTTLLLVPSNTPGFRVGKVFNKSGWRFYQNAELIFENARVPHANVVGEVNGAFRARGGAFGDFELAANALGVCEAAVEMAMQHAKNRTTDDKPVFEHQVIQLKLSEMHFLTEALRSYVMRTAWEMDQNAGRSANASLVMNYSTDIIQRVTQLNMDIHGVGGCLMNAGVDKLVRDAIIWTHLAGDATQRMKAARRIK